MWFDFKGLYQLIVFLFVMAIPGVIVTILGLIWLIAYLINHLRLV